MSNVYQLDPHTNMSVRDALGYALRNAGDLSDVIIVAYDGDGELYVWSSHIDRRDALWMLMDSVDKVRSGE